MWCAYCGCKGCDQVLVVLLLPTAHGWGGAVWPVLGMERPVPDSGGVRAERWKGAVAAAAAAGGRGGGPGLMEVCSWACTTTCIFRKKRLIDPSLAKPCTSTRDNGVCMAGMLKVQHLRRGCIRAKEVSSTGGPE